MWSSVNNPNGSFLKQKQTKKPAKHEVYAQKIQNWIRCAHGKWKCVPRFIFLLLPLLFCLLRKQHVMWMFTCTSATMRFISTPKTKREKRKNDNDDGQNLICESYCCYSPLFLSALILFYTGFGYLVFFPSFEASKYVGVLKKKKNCVRGPKIQWKSKRNKLNHSINCDRIYLIINYNFKK